MVFGQNRTIPLIIKRLEDILTKVETFEIAYTDAQHLSNSELISIYKGLSDEAVKKMKLISGDSYTKMAFQLFQEDPRWLIKVPSQRDYVAIKDFVDKNGAHIDLSDRTKACFLVNKCCEDRGFPEYILRRIKLFVPMIKMYSFNYKDVCPMMM